MKRILVTGVSGLLGLNLALQAAGRYEVWGVTRKERLVPQSSPPFHPLYADLTRPGQVDQLLAEAQPDIVVHCAAMTEVDYCEAHPVEAHLINAHVPEILAQVTARLGVDLVHISTDAVFDGTYGEYIESDPPNPINIYGKSKLSGERAVADRNPDALIARVNFYGWSWQGKRSLAEFFYNQLAAGTPIHGFTDLVFSPLLVNDMIEILLRMVRMGLGGLYHVVSAESMSKYAFGRLLARQFGFDEQLISPSSYKTANLRAPRARLLTLRSEKLAQALDEALPGQAAAMQRFYQLSCQGYPQTLKNIFAAPDHSPVG